MGGWAVDAQETLTVGDPAAGHVVMDNLGLRLYGADGVTVLVDLDVNGTATFTGTLGVGSTVPGSTVTGSVANAGSAVNATNLAGGGNAAGVTTIAGSFIVGNPAAAHAVVGTDANGASGFRLYASNGVNVVMDLNTNGTNTFKGSVSVGSVVPGSTVSGSVNAATTATNLGGGGSAAGNTNIAGSLIVGSPGGSHVVVGSDANGADGVRLYASDGVTPLIDLTISGTPTITGATIQTATSGPRWRLTGTTSALIIGPTGSTSETTAPNLQTSTIGTVGTTAQSRLTEASGAQTAGFAKNQAFLDLLSTSADGTKPSVATLGVGVGVPNVGVPDSALTLTEGAGGSITVTGGAAKAIVWDANGNLTLGTGTTLSVPTVTAATKATAPNLPLVSDGLVVGVTVASGATSGTATFTWPKGLFTGGTPVASCTIVSPSGNAIRATLFFTSVTTTGGTVRVDTNAALGASTTFNVHCKAEQYV